LFRVRISCDAAACLAAGTLICSIPFGYVRFLVHVYVFLKRNVKAEKSKINRRGINVKR